MVRAFNMTNVMLKELLKTRERKNGAALVHRSIDNLWLIDVYRWIWLAR